jgi:hypothetical protein
MLKELNNGPLYLGQTPSYITNIEHTKSFSGQLSNMFIFPSVFKEPEVKQFYESFPVTSLKSGLREESACLHVISMLRRCCNSAISPLLHVFSTPSVIQPVLKMIKEGSSNVAVASLRLCAQILPDAPLSLVDTQAREVGLIDENSTFLDWLYSAVGRNMNSWSRFMKRDNSTAMQSCGEYSFCFGWECVQLLHSLMESGAWAREIDNKLQECIQKSIPEIIEILSINSQQESLNPQSELATYVHASFNDVDTTFAILGLLCGAADGLHIGAKARCIVGEGEGILEDCTLLSPTFTNSKADKKDKKNAEVFGSSFVVVLDSQPNDYITVERNKLIPVSTSVGTAMENLLRRHESGLIQLYNLFLKTDCTDNRPVALPKVVESDRQIVVESPHPYTSGMNTYRDISMPGAKSLRIEFDPQCRTVGKADFVKFYKGQDRTEYYGEEKYYGRDSDQNWPVVSRGMKPLIIPADSFVSHFHSENANSEWGYKFTVYGHCVEKTMPPAVPPLLHLSVLSDMKAAALKSLDLLLKNFPWFIKPSLPLLKNLVSASLSRIPKVNGAVVIPKPLVLESSHPYEHNKDEYIPVQIKGAKKLVITFDEQTATENGCDYVKLYKDQSRGEMWGEQYSGGKDNGNSNWPGMKGRAPLIIPADNFVLYFHTDGSVNSW